MSTEGRIEAHRAEWTARLGALAAGPLALAPGFAETAARWEAWWRFEADRPLLAAAAAKAEPPRWGKAFDLLDRPDEWLRVRRRQVECLHYVGEAIPSVRVDLGPVATAAFLGAPLRLSESEQTTWQDPVFDDWSGADAFRFDPANPWFRRVLELAERTAADAAGRYLVCLPDLTGSVDVLANLRGPENLCLDLVERREAVIGMAARIVDDWEAVYTALCDAILSRGAGVVQWLGCWSNTPYTLPTCDFNFMISPADFREVCLPSLAEQARRAGRCVFHLDGPGAARHADALAAEPSITAVQFTPGAGSPSALPWLPMFRRLQAAGKPLVLCLPKAEVAEVAAALDPRGLALLPEGVQSPREADELFARVADG